MHKRVLWADTTQPADMQRLIAAVLKVFVLPRDSWSRRPWQTHYIQLLILDPTLITRYRYKRTAPVPGGPMGL